MQRTIDWKAVYATPLFDVGACHAHCGGYCCRNFYADDFRILSAKEVILPMLESEYDYLTSIGGLEGVSDRASYKEFAPVEGHSVRLVFMRCSCEGLCRPHAHRPFICRLYPYFPLVDADGMIVGFDYAALVDLFYASPEQHPCHLVAHCRSAVQSQMTAALQPLVANPEMIFLLRALERITTSLREKIGGTFDPMDSEGRKAFLKKYEYEVFTWSAWRTRKFKDEIAQIYRAAFGL
ncbi:MAG: hypothetical protein GX621_04935 [Pirellulaceae bacterium]|nr:hypothetical protein [Pirellulaceae bacterium]